MSEAGNSISSFYHKINTLQQSNLFRRLLQSPSSWIETRDDEEINLAYELETYGLVNINSQDVSNKDSIRVRITHN